MNCRQARKLLTYSMGAHGEAMRHVSRCQACSRFADHLKDVDRALQTPRSQVSPPADFARRVKRRLERTEDLLGWAALRLLPATLALILLLSWLNLREGAATTVEGGDPTDAVVSWMLDPDAGLDAGEDS